MPNQGSRTRLTERSVLGKGQLKFDLFQEPLLGLFFIARSFDFFHTDMAGFTVQSILDGRSARTPVVDKSQNVRQTQLEEGIDDCTSVLQLDQRETAQMPSFTSSAFCRII